jgi:hypothetical protein
MTQIAYRIRTTAKDDSGRRIKVETFDRKRAMDRLRDIQVKDPAARVIGIPVGGR